jgi:hypothetical protein
MVTFPSARAGQPVAADPAVLSLAVAAYLARYKGLATFTNNLGNSVTVDLDHPEFA